MLRFHVLTFHPMLSKLARGIDSARLFSRIPIDINESDLEERFVRGSGPGGQAVNKTNNKVQLRHIPTGHMVQCHETRDRSSNRKIARKLLALKLDHILNGENSKLALKQEKIRRRKRKAARYYLFDVVKQWLSVTGGIATRQMQNIDNCLLILHDSFLWASFLKCAAVEGKSMEEMGWMILQM